MENNINRLFKGLNQDNIYADQPKGTYRFALNAIMETDQGDNNIISNEESNEIYTHLTPNYTPIGKVYMGKDRIAIWSVSEDNSTSEIGIFYPNSKKYIVEVNDADVPDEYKLNFSINHPIDATYRLRRGCENTVYWVDGDNNRPRYYDFNKPENFQTNGIWIADKFNLQKTYKKIPEFKEIEVLDSGGSLESGSINFDIQYIDESLNPTEFISSSNPVYIYPDLTSKNYAEIQGAINSDTDYLDFPTSGKSIKLTLSNLDQNFLYYRIAIIKSDNGSGLVSSIEYSETIPTTKNTYIYTGTNAVSKGTEEEIKQVNSYIGSAQHIKQLDNMLVLANTKGVQVDYCALQKYASKIKTDCTVKTVILNDINDPANTKNPSHAVNGGLGYMPGEIYSLGIVYILEGNIVTPAYHIPGKPEKDGDAIYAPEYDSNGNQIVFPMSTKDNTGETTYSDNSTCSNSSYWGLDCNGTPLNSKKVRHHRFPRRSDINVPLINTDYKQEQQALYYQLKIRLVGNIKTPVPCEEGAEDCTSDEYYSFNIRVDYKISGEDYFFVESIDPQEFADGVNNSVNIDTHIVSNYHSSKDFTDIVITITDTKNIYQDFGTWSTADNTSKCKSMPDYIVSGELCLTPFPEVYTSTTQGKLVTSQILGFKFSGIEKPPKEVTGGLEVIGYYIVRNERTEFEKTILDSAVLFPTVVNNKYISSGLIQPETNSLSGDIFSIIHPEHKFNNREYVIFDEIFQEGNYKIKERKYGKINYDDVYDGSSYNSKTMRSGNDDGHDADGSPTSRGYDGWSFNLISRDSIVNFESKNNFTLTKENIKENFYLDALDHKSINEDLNDVYNIACDNKIGILQTSSSGIIDTKNNNMPYVVYYKKNADSYANFRNLPYYKDTINPVYFNNSESSTKKVFNGDSYITPMRYVNTLYWDNRVADRKGKSSIWKVILGAAIALIGAALTFIIPGASAVVVGTGISLIGAGALTASSGIKLANYNKAYSEEYAKGLRQTALDDWTDAFYNYKNNKYTNPGNGTFGFVGDKGGGSSGPSDDTIQWIADCVTDLWFESSLNMNLRNGFVDDTLPTFLASPWRVESGNDTKIDVWEYRGKIYTNSNAQRYPISSLERHEARKLLAFDDSRDDNRYYLGLSLGEYYNINPDYLRKNKQKVYYHLALEYDCCSDCNETFPHRIMYSLQSYQEELSDNYRIFLPNNYKDIEGETGAITNLITFNDDLYVHTEEALWLMPRNYQERVTDQIVSFIGTGEYFSIPPRKMLDDDNGNSAGCTHKLGTIKTPYGIVFPSENQAKIYLFDGKNLKPISNLGLNSWFKNNIPVNMDKDYYSLKQEEYPYRDNPYHKFGTGFLSAYDSNKERLLITKKDKTNTTLINTDNEDFEICSNGDEMTIFNNISEIIAAQEAEGWSYRGIKNCQMEFSKDVQYTKEEIREVVTNVTIPPDTIIVPFFDTTSMNADDINNISNTLNSWFTTFKQTINNGDNDLVFLNPGTGISGWNRFNTEDWVVTPADVVLKRSEIGENKNVLLLVFVDESNPSFHGNKLSNPMSEPTAAYISAVNNFVENLYPKFKSFIAINYPIVQNSAICREYLQHAVAAIEAKNMTQIEVDALSKNKQFSDQEWTIVKNNLMNNPYVGQPKLKENYGWLYKEDRVTGVGNNDSTDCPTDGVSVITPCQFTIDIENLLKTVQQTITEEIVVEVVYTKTEFKYILGKVVESAYVNNSWTISYNLKENYWISWHSYMPSFYLEIPNNIFSCYTGNNSILRHNKKGEYQNFFNKRYPFIIEYVSLSNPLVTRIWEYITLMTEAKKYEESFNEFTEERFITFNKALFYNSKQSSGILNLVVKDNMEGEYLLNQVKNLEGDSIIIDRKEKDWHINELRDLRVDYNAPMFDSNIKNLQEDYFIDKKVNTASIDINKDWTQLESFRDKYLVVRLIFDNFDNIKLSMKYSVENEDQSYR